MPSSNKDADFSEYLAARRGTVLRTAYLLSGDAHTAEDLTQEAFAKLYLSWTKVKDTGAMDGYVRRILINEHTSLWRRAWRRRETVSTSLVDQPSHDQAGTHDEQLWSLVCSLPTKQRAAVVLRYYEELSEAETAQALGVSVGTVKSQTSRALATLRTRRLELVEPHNIESLGGQR